MSGRLLEEVGPLGRTAGQMSEPLGGGGRGKGVVHDYTHYLARAHAQKRQKK